MSKPRLTVLAGAGASMSYGLPGTQQLTDLVLRDDGSSDPLGGYRAMKLVYGLISQHYESPNFEHLLNVLEAAIGLQRTWQPSTPSSLKVAYGILCDRPTQEAARLFYDSSATFAAHELVVRLYDSLIESVPRNVTEYNGFWTSLADSFDLDVITTNYDTLIENSGIPFSLGFSPIADEAAWRFEPSLLIGPRHRLFHIHGCVRFGRREMQSDPNRFWRKDDWHDLYWYPDARKARDTLYPGSNSSSQAGDELVIGPIITGMQKTAKLMLVEPYLSYQRSMYEILRSNPRLLLLGYGFGDLHINALLNRMASWHPSLRRIALVTFADRETWLQRHHNLVQLEELSFVRKVSGHKESWTFDDHDPWDSDGEDLRLLPWKSDDDSTRIYVDGLQEVARSRLSELIGFLNAMQA